MIHFIVLPQKIFTPNDIILTRHYTGTRTALYRLWKQFAMQSQVRILQQSFHFVGTCIIFPWHGNDWIVGFLPQE